jgi:hypothetical protein
LGPWYLEKEGCLDLETLITCTIYMRGIVHVRAQGRELLRGLYLRVWDEERRRWYRLKERVWEKVT